MAKRKQLHLARNGIFGGVCGGIAEHFDIDPILLRVPLFLSIWFYGIGLLLYLAFWISMPYADDVEDDA